MFITRHREGNIVELYDLKIWLRFTFFLIRINGCLPSLGTMVACAFL